VPSPTWGRLEGAAHCDTVTSGTPSTLEPMTLPLWGGQRTALAYSAGGDLPRPFPPGHGTLNLGTWARGDVETWRSKVGAASDCLRPSEMSLPSRPYARRSRAPRLPSDEIR
jgi:hypothetical protein